jgi:hypothetical protein
VKCLAGDQEEFNIAIAQFIPLGEAVFDELRD